MDSHRQRRGEYPDELQGGCGLVRGPVRPGFLGEPDCIVALCCCHDCNTLRCVGHGSISVTTDRYGHLTDGLDDQIAVDRDDDARADAAAPPALLEQYVCTPLNAQKPLQWGLSHESVWSSRFGELCGTMVSW
jgi:hypothetical protein